MKKNSPIEKWEKDMNRQFRDKDIQQFLNRQKMFYLPHWKMATTEMFTFHLWDCQRWKTTRVSTTVFTNLSCRWSCKLMNVYGKEPGNIYLQSSVSLPTHTWFVCGSWTMGIFSEQAWGSKPTWGDSKRSKVRKETSMTMTREIKGNRHRSCRKKTREDKKEPTERKSMEQLRGSKTLHKEAMNQQNELFMLATRSMAQDPLILILRDDSLERKVAKK